MIPALVPVITSVIVVGHAKPPQPLWFACQSGFYASLSVKVARLPPCRVAMRDGARGLLQQQAAQTPSGSWRS